jgi:hypothetical protein
MHSLRPDVSADLDVTAFLLIRNARRTSLCGVLAWCIRRFETVLDEPRQRFDSLFCVVAAGFENDFHARVAADRQDVKDALGVDPNGFSHEFDS